MTRVPFLLVLVATTLFGSALSAAASAAPPVASDAAATTTAPSAASATAPSAASATAPSAASAADVTGAPAPTAGDATSASATADLPAAAPDRSESRSKTESDRRAHQRGRTWGYVSLAMGGIGALIAVGTSIAMVDELDQRNKGCNADKVCTVDGLSANQSLSQLAPWNVGSWIVTVGSFAAGAYLLMTNPPDNRSKDSAQLTGVGITALGSGAGLSARGTF